MTTRSIRSLAIGLFVLIAALIPAAAAPPPPADCSDPDHGARVRCKAANVLAQQQATTDTINQLEEVPESRRQNLMKQTERTMHGHGRTDAADYKQLAKKKNPQCQIAEIEGDGMGDDDGICRGSEDCVEVIGDQIGDDTQPCRTHGNPADREVCVEMCDPESVDAEPDNFDEAGRGQEVEDELDDVTDEYMALNESLEEAVTLRNAMHILAADGDPCSTVFGDRIAAGWMWASLGAKLLIEGITDIHDKFCNQDVGGFNGATACAIFEGIKAVAVSQYEVLDNIDGNQDSDTIDASFACLKSLNTSVGESNDALESIETKVNALDQQIRTLQGDVETVREMLQTPPGRRPGFPSKNR